MRPAPMIELEDAHFDPQASTAEEVTRRWRAIGHQARFEIRALRVFGSPIAASHNYIRGSQPWGQAGGAAT